MQKKEGNRFIYHGVGFSAGLDDMADNFDQEEEELKARQRHIKKLEKENVFMKEHKPNKKDVQLTDIQNDRHHNQKMAIKKENLLQNNFNLEDLIKQEIVKPHIHHQGGAGQKNNPNESRNDA